MTSVTGRTPWVLARSAQAATGVAALADVFRAVAVRDLHLHDTGATDHKAAFASMVFLYAMTLAIVLFLVWLARSRRNAQQLSPLASVPSPGWTIGAWFIPVVNLFVPRRLVLDIGRASSGSWEQRRGTTLVNLWWAAWVSHTLMLVVAAQVAPGSIALVVAAEALMIAAAVLLGLVIERVTAIQSSAPRATMPAAPLAQA
ncbi:DUF4328 domain-containing protein [Streptomyces turgidiscabies]|uniref:DUF4328 domain-containing protein n=1 Tax=Streptomyces turgidiscabies (strain Car8) TaxID=698760 RepID=L7F4H1_STRT8|nr:MULTISPECIES: DUF4328 domain-containing protein [Streptomyces]ELP66014.1 hypothetical protein STRTUCAR8_02007 [Streptomyces turgidiscabies Car8]MDX3498406.1 DUF4328 domain-containing protein [Streptomyces turgidiscabies]GAQ74554.1 hypothetical protein T45_06330 [Streptomyces turgidiscabies]